MCRKGVEYYIEPLVSSMPLFVLFLNPCLREDRGHYTQSFLPQPFSLMKTFKTFCPFLLEIRANINPSVFFFCPMSQLAINLRETLNVFFQDSHLVESIKPSPCPLYILPTSLFKKVSHNIGPCLLTVINSSLITCCYSFSFKKG